MFEGNLQCRIIAIPSQPFSQFIAKVATEKPGDIYKSQTKWIGTNIVTLQDENVTIARIGSLGYHDAVAIIPPINSEVVAYAYASQLSYIANPESRRAFDANNAHSQPKGLVVRALNKFFGEVPDKKPYADEKVYFAVTTTPRAPDGLSPSWNSSAFGFVHDVILMNVYNKDLSVTLSKAAIDRSPEEVVTALTRMFAAVRHYCVVRTPQRDLPRVPGGGPAPMPPAFAAYKL